MSKMFYSDISFYLQHVPQCIYEQITNEGAYWATKRRRDNLLSVSLTDPRGKK